MGLLSRLLGTEGAARDLLADLTEDYRAEAAQAALLRAHAERARYPQAASALRGLAEMEARHAERLRTHLLALGGQPPTAAPATVGGNNQWERAVAALHAAQAKRRRLVEQIAHWDPEEPGVVALLRQIEQEDQSQQPVYEALIMRSDPQSID
jgi:hypothetical protein